MLFEKNVISIPRCDFVDPPRALPNILCIPWWHLRRARYLKVALEWYGKSPCNQPMIGFLLSLPKFGGVQIDSWPTDMSPEWEDILKPLQAIVRKKLHPEISEAKKQEMEVNCPELFEMCWEARIVGGMANPIDASGTYTTRIPSSRIYWAARNLPARTL